MTRSRHNDKRSWLGMLLAFLDPNESAPNARREAGARTAAPRAGPAANRPRQEHLECVGPARAHGARRRAAKRAEPDPVEHHRAPDESLSARVELSGIRFWPSEALETADARDGARRRA